LPAANRNGIVVNLAALRLFRFAPDGTVMTFPISVGREGWDTPTGTTQIVQKRKDPVWTVPASIRAEDPSLPAVIPAGPDNPLGQYALSLGWPGYLIHGTNKPSSIGRPSSHGCMRMYPEDVEILFGAVEVGESVTVVDTPITLGQSGGRLYLQVTPTRDQAKSIAAYKPVLPLTEADAPVAEFMERLSALKAAGAEIDDQAVADAIARHDGMPVAIGTAPIQYDTASQSVNHN
jgi:L,D-transpeptidase ErfK/SrfK